MEGSVYGMKTKLSAFIITALIFIMIISIFGACDKNNNEKESDKNNNDEVTDVNNLPKDETVLPVKDETAIKIE
ncbi:MAG: hypothetical protein K0S55_1147, partial [Clostridia bacterium]|nr:hypothetical protein [Clostridia bacterium]